MIKYGQERRGKKMTNEEILKKAIEKAVRGNFDRKEAHDFLEVFAHFENKLETQECFITALIFSHEFAKAFWGESEVYEARLLTNKKHNDGDWIVKTSRFVNTWQFHLQQMVLVEDKLKYLEKFINEKR